MKVSVCITVYNEEKNIERLLDSLVDQTKKPDEVIIVDGGSTDATLHKLSTFKKQFSKRGIKYKIIKKKCSRAVGRNISVRIAKHEIITMTDAGCIANPDWLEKITNPFSKKTTKVVAGFYDMVGETPIQKAASFFLGVMPEDFNEKFLPSTRSISFKKRVWEKVGGFPEELEDTAEDTIFNYKLLINGVKIIRVKDARVEWGIPYDLSDIAHKMYSYAKGDAKSGVVNFPSKGIASHNIKMILKLLRYFLFLFILISGVFVFPLLIILIILLFTYGFYAFYKVYRRKKSIAVGLWGIFFQFLSDWMGIAGFLEGVFEKFSHDRKVSTRDNKNLPIKIKYYLKYAALILKNEINLRKGVNVIYCLGDSHMTIFKEIEKSEKFKNSNFFTFAIGGATAMGMGNPLSKTKAYSRFDRFLRYMNKRASLLIGLGEVDCGFVIWYRKDKYNTSVDKQLKLALKRYQKFLRDVKEMGFKNVIILSVQPPTIMDGRDKGNVAKLRAGISADLQKRTELTKKFNIEMKKFCDHENIRFLDLFSEVTDKNGVVKEKYLNKDVYDHHLNPETTIPILVRKLRRLGFS